MVHSLRVNTAELELLNDIDELGFGELYEVERTSGQPVKAVGMTEKQANLVRLIRQRSLEKVVIHEGDPVSAEYRMTLASGRKCLKKIRF